MLAGGKKREQSPSIFSTHSKSSGANWLAAQQRHAFQSHRDVQQEIESLIQRQFDGGVHDESDGA